jgi:hypothetical protein
MLVKWQNGGLYIGRDFMRDMDVEISLAWDRRENPPRGEFIFRREIALGWNWLPQLWWHYAEPWRRMDEVAAVSWTGRARRLVRVSWPAWAHFRRIDA